ncbi:MAG: DEAD/DEAH box helicase [Planctomycetes bacterium]|nr:DEAD/DEAH box helicase [Planctomycetota bacterium]
MSRGAAPIESALERVLGRKGEEVITAVRRVPARAARFADWPAGLPETLVAAYRARGIERPFVHQALAWEHVAAGRHAVTVTPTASGKTLCYNVPVLARCLADPSTRALYLFPTKALAQDQVAELQEVIDRLGAPIKTWTYDGDTPDDARRAIRAQGNIVVTNPDMLHQGILPHHTKWAKLFQNLRYVVIDELHTYRGVFGSHVANVVRRLKRICRFHGSDPVFVCSSATIANPAELASRLVEEPVALVDDNGAPSGEKVLVFLNPPVINRELGIRRSYLTTARSIAAEFLKREVPTIVFATSRLNVEVLSKYLKEEFERRPHDAGMIRGYRGGYLPNTRREIEQGLRRGDILGVVTTNALELGIDIGALGACVLAGYPGTVASTWQQAGRAGRRAGVSAAVFVAKSEPLDQFMVTHPEYFFSKPPEAGLVNPDNLLIRVAHVKCAAFELPIRDGERFGGDDLPEILKYLQEERILHPADGRWHWNQEVYPADTVSLRSVANENFVIMDQTRQNQVLAEVDYASAPATVYEDAIYLCESEIYHVKRLDYAQRRAYVARVDADYYTDAITGTAVKVLEVDGAAEVAGGASAEGEGGADLPSPRPSPAAAGEGEGARAEGKGGAHIPPPRPSPAAAGEGEGAGADGDVAGATAPVAVAEHGDVHVAWRVSGFKKIKFATRENVGFGTVNLPDQEMQTTACWWILRAGALAGLPWTRAEVLDGVVGIAYAMQHIAPLLLMCDVRDLERCVGDRGATWFAKADRESRGRYAFAAADGQPAGLTLETLPRFEPTLFLYDNYPGGIGLSPELFARRDLLLAATRAAVAACGCAEGCPSCVGPVVEMGLSAKAAALAILERLVGAVASPPRVETAS